MFMISSQRADNGDPLGPLGKGGGGGICLVTSIRGVFCGDCIPLIGGDNEISLLGGGGGSGILSTLVEGGDETITSFSMRVEGGIATSFQK
jgi:hypothetical protein